MTETLTFMRKTAKRTLIVVAAVFAAMLALGFVLQATDNDNAPNTTLPACEWEDGSGRGQELPCYWDADTRSNGGGADVINFPDGTYRVVND